MFCFQPHSSQRHHWKQLRLDVTVHWLLNGFTACYERHVASDVFRRLLLRTEIESPLRGKRQVPSSTLSLFCLPEQRNGGPRGSLSYPHPHPLCKRLGCQVLQVAAFSWGTLMSPGVTTRPSVDT